MKAAKIPAQVAENLARMKSIKVTGKCQLWETYLYIPIINTKVLYIYHVLKI